MGMLQIGVIHVPIYPTISEHDFEFIIKDAELKILLFQIKNFMKKYREFAKALIV